MLSEATALPNIVFSLLGTRWALGGWTAIMRGHDALPPPKCLIHKNTNTNTQIQIHKYTNTAYDMYLDSQMLCLAWWTAAVGKRTAIMRGHDALPPPLRQATPPSLRFGQPDPNVNALCDRGLFGNKFSY